jgi:hypothetical protein
MPPSEAVFETFELLETILFELPMQTLLLSQRVNKQWKSVLEGSTKLQQALFFKPIPGGPIPFTELPWLGWKDSATYNRIETLTTGKCIRNPLLCAMFKNFQVDWEESELYLQDFFSGRFKFTCQESWTRMLPTQPPINKCVYVECYYTDSSLEEHVDEINYDHGHTMLDIVAGLDSKMEEYAEKPDVEETLCFAAALVFGHDLQDNYQLENFIRLQNKKRKVAGLKDGNLHSWLGRKVAKRS